jgi:hypothetical protein
MTSFQNWKRNLPMAGSRTASLKHDQSEQHGRTHWSNTTKVQRTYLMDAISELNARSTNTSSRTCLGRKSVATNPSWSSFLSTAQVSGSIQHDTCRHARTARAACYESVLCGPVLPPSLVLCCAVMRATCQNTQHCDIAHSTHTCRLLRAWTMLCLLRLLWSCSQSCSPSTACTPPLPRPLPLRRARCG